MEQMKQQASFGKSCWANFLLLETRKIKSTDTEALT